MSDVSTKPYLIRAIYDWCVDNGYTPHIAVQVDHNTRVPQSYVRDGSIVLNLSANAVRNLQLGNEEITCTGRFGGVPYDIIVPIAAVAGIFARETGQGLVFQTGEATLPDRLETATTEEDDSPPSRPAGGRPRLRIVK